MVIMQQLPEITVASLITEHPTDGSWLIPTWKLICLISRIAVYGSVRTVVWEGRSAMGVPIPIAKALFNKGFLFFSTPI